MKTITPPHTVITHLERLGFENFVSLPDRISFTNFHRYITDAEYPEQVVNEIYKRVVRSTEEEGKKHLYKLVFDVLVFYGIACEFDVLASLFSLMVEEVSIITGDKNEELRIPLCEFRALLAYGQPKRKKKRGKCRVNRFLSSVAYEPLFNKDWQKD